MPTPSPSVETISLEPQSTYPELEAFVERASAEDVNQLFTRLKGSLDTLKGPRTEQAKKAKVALERTEDLLAGGGADRPDEDVRTLVDERGHRSSRVRSLVDGDDARSRAVDATGSVDVVDRQLQRGRLRRGQLSL